MATRKGSGQTALVTGASYGIGLDLAECFAKDGYDLVLSARSEALLKQEAERLAKQPGVVTQTIACDLGEHGAGQRLADEVGRLDIRRGRSANQAPGPGSAWASAPRTCRNSILLGRDR